MKKMITVAALAAAMAAFGASGVMAETVDKVDVEGITFEVPDDIRDLLTVTTEGLDENTLVQVQETASIEADKAADRGVELPGWVFSIVRVPEDEWKEFRSDMVDGMDVFAKADDFYYVFAHPTDVRFVRESNEEMEKGRELWTNLNEWAAEEVTQEILKNNSELEPKQYSCTELDTFLGMIAYQDYTDYEVKTLEYPELDASKLKGTEYAEKLAEEVFYTAIDEVENADGESIVLNFPEYDVRFEFLLGEDLQNIVREVITSEEGEDLYYYEAACEDSDETATGIMHEWVEAIAEASGETETEAE